MGTITFSLVSDRRSLTTMPLRCPLIARGAVPVVLAPRLEQTRVGEAMAEVLSKEVPTMSSDIGRLPCGG